MSLNENQIYNLIRFYFNINSRMDSPLLSQSPSYIIEKWEKWITEDKSIVNYNPNIIPLNEVTRIWIKRWYNISDGFLFSDNLNRFLSNPENHIIISVVNLLSSYETNVLDLISIISLFEKCFPNIDINNRKMGTLHQLVEEQIDKYMSYERNINQKKVYLRDTHIDNLIE